MADQHLAQAAQHLANAKKAYEQIMRIISEPQQHTVVDSTTLRMLMDGKRYRYPVGNEFQLDTTKQMAEALREEKPGMVLFRLPKDEETQFRQFRKEEKQTCSYMDASVPYLEKVSRELAKITQGWKFWLVIVHTFPVVACVKE